MRQSSSRHGRWGQVGVMNCSCSNRHAYISAALAFQPLSIAIRGVGLPVHIIYFMKTCHTIILQMSKLCPPESIIRTFYSSIICKAEYVYFLLEINIGRTKFPIF